MDPITLDILSVVLPAAGMNLLLGALWLRDRRRLQAECDWCAMQSRAIGRTEGAAKGRGQVYAALRSGLLP